MFTPSRRRMLAIGAGFGLTVLTGCAAAPGPPSDAAAPADPQPVRIAVSPPSGAVDVDPLTPAGISATEGTLDSVVMTNEAGTVVSGVLTPDRMVWKNTEPLGFGRTYTLTIGGRGRDGTISTTTATFTTLRPQNQTKVYLRTTGGHALTDGGTYGVGTVVVAHFDEPITDHVTAERHLVVTTDPPVVGSWYWLDDQNAHWRPEHYHQPGTRVDVEANVYGVAVGAGLYGQEDSRASFVIGDAHIAVADDDTKLVQVYENGTLIRTMPTSMGMGGSEVIGGRTISFWTQPGVYTVMDQANPAVMDSSTYGLPINSRLGYRETIGYATRISTDGVYLHQLDSTVWAQGNSNVSHGCLNLNTANARWFYDFSMPGDVVEVRNTGGAPLEVWQNGDWSMPWDQWVQGSAPA